MGASASIENATYDADKFKQSKAIMDMKCDDTEKFAKLKQIWNEGKDLVKSKDEAKDMSTGKNKQGANENRLPRVHNSPVNDDALEDVGVLFEEKEKIHANTPEQGNHDAHCSDKPKGKENGVHVQNSNATVVAAGGNECHSAHHHETSTEAGANHTDKQCHAGHESGEHGMHSEKTEKPKNDRLDTCVSGNGSLVGQFSHEPEKEEHPTQAHDTKTTPAAASEPQQSKIHS